MQSYSHNSYLFWYDINFTFLHSIRICIYVLNCGAIKIGHHPVLYWSITISWTACHCGQIILCQVMDTKTFELWAILANIGTDCCSLFMQSFLARECPQCLQIPLSWCKVTLEVEFICLYGRHGRTQVLDYDICWQQTPFFWF